MSREINAPASNLALTSTDIAEGGRVPTRCTGDGEDLSPALAWHNVPEGTASFALICEDPDAPSPRRPAPEPWVHWVVYNLPAELRALPAGVPREPVLADWPPARQGKNSWPSENVGYRGPAPPPGSGRHRYVFRLFALDTMLEPMNHPPTKAELAAAMRGHVLGEARLTGTYER